MNFLDVFNIVADSVGNKPANAPKATSYDNDPIDVGLDSLDMIMVVEVLIDIYGLPNDDEKIDNISRATIGSLRDYVDTYKKRDPVSVEEVLEYV
jgi:acyl carrier protein|tara:strand:+ start:47 stop:331 length:285 start_codon:yes stop_codon:yes gene_type:complete